MRRVTVAVWAVALAAALAAAGKINHIVVLMEENRSFDHMLGLFNGTQHGTRGKDLYNDVSYTLKNGTRVTKRVPWSGTAPYVNYCDPDHSFPATTDKIFGHKHPAKDAPEDMAGFAEFEFHRHGEKFGLEECNVMEGFTPERLPVMTALAENFVLMDKFFCSVPGPTWPNRMFFMAGTSDGLTETGPWYEDHTGSFFPGKTIFDQVGEAGGTWAVYYDDTPWELFMQSLADQPQNLKQMDAFYADAAAGTLPSFSFINPRAGVNLTLNVGSNDMHPDHDVALGEALYRDVYQALRKSPKWEETLFVLTFDEHGGFYDHVAPPRDVPPPTVGQKSYPDEFDFSRGGIRIPTILISPWVPKGATLSDPPAAQRPAPNSAYELTSIMATARKLLGFLNGTKPLTGRDAWAATFEHVFDVLPAPRTDCPAELPAPPPFAGRRFLEEEAAMPVNSLQRHIMQVHANLNGEAYPAHVQRQGDVEAWSRSRLEAHTARTAAWRRSKAVSQSAAPKMAAGAPAVAKVATPDPRYRMMLQPLHEENAGRDWHINVGNTSKVAGQWVSTLSVKLHNGTVLCMDGGDMTNGTFIGVSVCHPSADPRFNRDPSQRWLRPSDATVRPASNPELCITNNVQAPQGGADLYLTPCDGSVQQHYSWQSHEAVQPGSGAGVMFYGDGLYEIAVLLLTEQ